MLRTSYKQHAVRAIIDFGMAASNFTAMAILSTGSTWFKSDMDATAADIALKTAFGVLAVAAICKFGSVIVNRSQIDSKEKKVHGSFKIANSTLFVATSMTALAHACHGDNLLDLSGVSQTIFLSLMVASFTILAAQQVTTITLPDATNCDKRMAVVSMGSSLGALGFAATSLYGNISAATPDWVGQVEGATGTMAACGFGVTTVKAVIDVYKAYQAHRAATSLQVCFRQFLEDEGADHPIEGGWSV